MAETEPRKGASYFFPSRLREDALRNVQRYRWARETANLLIEEAEPWRRLDEDSLWGLMFGPTITRSWHVWSNGYCPACRKPVPMYGWVIEPWKAPWKVRCPHCQHLFPTNDFEAYYRSGIDERGVFDPQRADRSLLFNTQHPNPADPLHRFGVDDGEGYVDGEDRWRFIGAYLVYGQWKGLVLSGLKNLAAAYLVTGNPEYARKAGILLDRVADLYPLFDHKTQAVVYETVRADGYVSVWHDACEETRLLALVYDAIFEAIRGDKPLVAFLAEKSRQYRLPNPKRSFTEIAYNIEQGLLVDPQRNLHKIHSNFPRTPFTQAVLMAVHHEPVQREAIRQLLQQTLARATAIDGVTGEKGLAGYAAFAVKAIAEMLALFARADEGFLRWAIERFPLRDTFRFHLDTWVDEQYYPLIGDTGVVAQRVEQYAGASFLQLPASGGYVFGSDPVFTPSMFTFFWQIYQATGDADFVRILYRGNGKRVDGLPHDLFAKNPKSFQQSVKRVLQSQGTAFQVPSVNKSRWHLAILRSGKGNYSRAVWLDYDSGGAHGHEDAMNLGLFAFGLDLMPDFGYPPVQYGGWTTPQVRWYLCSQAHNTVIVDGRTQSAGDGKCTLWHPEPPVQVVRASAPHVYSVNRYERTVLLVDVSDEAFYVVDVFRVQGGQTHDRFLHSHFSKATVNGSLDHTSRPPEYAQTLMRNFSRIKPHVYPTQIDWQVEDRLQYLPKGKRYTLRCIDLTPDAESYLCEGWVSFSGFSGTEEAWLPRLMTRRRSPAQLNSTFVAVLVPFEEPRCPVTLVRRLTLLAPDGTPRSEHHVAIEIMLAQGDRDLIVIADPAEPSPRQWRALQPDWQLTVRTEVLVRRESRVRERCFHIALGREAR